MCGVFFGFGGKRGKKEGRFSPPLYNPIPRPRPPCPQEYTTQRNATDPSLPSPPLLSPSQPHPSHPANPPKKSLPHRPRLHLHPAPPGGRPEPLRASVGAVVADPERGEDPHQRDEHAGGAERREPRERRGREDVAREEGGV